MRAWLYCILIFLISCGIDKRNGDPITDLSIYSKIAQADSLFEKGDSLRAFVKLRNSSTILEVFDFNKWPEDIDIIYNLCYNGSQVILFKEIPQNEFDEYSIYRSYYLDSDAVFAIDIESRHFNENCSESAIVENKLYMWEKGKLTVGKYSLTDVKGVLMDSATCSFAKSGEFNRYRTLSETPLADFARN